MKTLAEVRTYVRTHLDVTSEDIPDLLIDRWTRSAVERIVHSRRRFKFYETVTTLSITSGTQSYTNPLNAGRLASVIVDARKLQPMDVPVMLGKTSAGSYLTHYGLYGDKVYFYPTPAEAKTVTLLGQRAPVWTWVTDGSAIDLPDDYEPILLAWVLCEAFKHQQDIPMANNYAVDFETLLRETNARYVDTPDTFIGASIS